MYKKIVVPVDLAHADTLAKALQTSADLARHYGAEITYVGVTTNLPSSVAHTAAEYQQKLEGFAGEQGRKFGIEIKAKTIVSHDPARDLDDRLGEEIRAEQADLVVMASHVPIFSDHVFASNAGYLASHATTSVFIVR